MYDNTDNFFYKAKQTVYKWWCVIYKPVYKLTHHGYWPAEKEPYYVPPQESSNQQQLAAQMAETIMHNRQSNVDNIVMDSATPNASATDTNPIATHQSEESIDLSQVNPNDLNRAQEILDRLNREAAADEAKKQAAIDAAKKQADEKARLDAIMRANQVDISAFIEEGKAKAQEETSSDRDTNASDDALKRAQEIMDRLNREAAEDEAKKQAEIDAAKALAKSKGL